MNCNVLFESTHGPFILDKLKHYIKSVFRLWPVKCVVGLTWPAFTANRRQD